MFKSILVATALAIALPASAAITVDVAGTSRPWNFTDGGLNSTFQFGIGDGTGPVVVDFASAGITAGGSWAVLYKSGLTSAFGGAPIADQNGHVGLIFKDDVLGSSGKSFPSLYMPSLWSTDPGAGVFLNALVFVFTDDTGQIIGTPDAMEVTGDAINGYSFTNSKFGDPTPVGATRIQLGLNDDIFADNTGSLQVCVGATIDDCLRTTTDVSEPADWSLMVAGATLLGLASRRRRVVAA